MSGAARRLVKLTRPRLHGAVPRDRLFQILDEARAHQQVVGIVGPPGSGKTTLAASWLDARAALGIWFRVDPGDGDLASFFYYLAEAARPYTRKRMRPLPLLTPEYRADLEGYSRRFFRELFARFPSGAVLVLDNLHELPTDHSLHGLIAQAAEEVPDTACLGLISRRIPSEHFSRLVAHGDMRVLRWEDLRLAPEESIRIVSARPGADPSLAMQLHAYADGWVAGLVLAIEHAAAFGSCDGIEGLTQESVFDYFASQIFDREPEPHRRFLAVTSLLPAISVEMARALSGHEAAAELMADLHRRQLFTHRNPGHPATYTYHQLFRDFLQRQLATMLSPEGLAEIRRRAARLLEALGDPAAAIGLHGEAHEWSDAVRCVVETAPRLIAQGRWQTLEDWITALPPSHRDADTWLIYWQGMARLAFDPTRALERLEQAFDRFGRSGDTTGTLLAAAAAAQGIYLEATNFRRLSRWLPVLERGYPDCSRLPDPTKELQVVSALLIAALFARPGHPLQHECARRTLALMTETIDPNQRLTAASAAILHALYTGDLAFGRQMEATVAPLVDSPEATALNVSVWYCYLGWMSVADHTPARGMEALDRAEAIAEREGFAFILTSSYAGRSALLRIGPDTEVWLSRAEAVMDRGRAYDVAHLIGNVMYRAADRGDWEATVQHGVRTVDYLEGMGSYYQRLIWETPIAWALAELGRMDEAVRHLDVSKQLMRETEAECYHALVTLTEARLACLQGDRAAYRRLLADGFGRAARDYAIGRYALWVPTVGAAQLCVDALGFGIEPDYVAAYIREYGLLPPYDAPVCWPWKLRIHTLGRFEVQVDGTVLGYSRKTPRKPLALLKAIVAFGIRNVPVQKLLDAIWPEEDGDSAQRAFEAALHRLRKLLGSHDAIRAADRVVSLNDSLVWTDIEALERLLVRLDTAPPGIIGPDELMPYAGVFLPADVDAPWSASRRHLMHSRITSAVGGAGVRLEKLGAWDEALRWFEAGIAIDDLVESFHQGAIRCHLGSGRPARALAQFERVRRVLASRLRATPSAATVELVARFAGS